MVIIIKEAEVAIKTEVDADPTKETTRKGIEVIN